MNDMVSHGTVVIERLLKASPERSFAAWASKEALMAWGSPGDESWNLVMNEFDFRAGGRESSHFGPKTGGERYHNETVYLDIVENRRIVQANSMTAGGRRIFAGLITIEFQPDGDGCRVKVTEQGAHFGVTAEDAGHEYGWSEMLSKLERFLGVPKAA